MSRPASVYNAAAIATIIAMRGEAKTSRQIARAVGTTKGSVEARMSQLGLTKLPKPTPEIAA
jgi:hypothetical protein